MKKEKTKKAYEFEETAIQYGDIKSPVWIVGHDPFEDEYEKIGHVVHLVEPRFIARYFYGGGWPDNATMTGLTYSATEITNDNEDITLCEIVWHDPCPEEDRLRQVLHEACAAIAHYHGDLLASFGVIQQ